MPQEGALASQTFLNGAAMFPFMQRCIRHSPNCDEDAWLVAEWSLAPMLLGKVRSPGERPNWEQPASQWIPELVLAGYSVDEVRTIAQYSRPPAFLIIAHPRTS